MTTAYPLSWPNGWPRTPHHMRVNTNKFNTTFERARRRLVDQLRLMDAENAVLSTNLPLRLDGQPYSDAARRIIEDPGVAIYFMLRGKQMVMARDLYNTPQDNLRSLGLAIEHLRGLERHGGAHMIERAFAGFAALPPPTGGAETPVNWREIFAPVPTGVDNADLLAIVENRFRMMAKNTHTDTGGSDAAMIRLNAAIALARKELRA